MGAQVVVDGWVLALQVVDDKKTLESIWSLLLFVTNASGQRYFRIPRNPKQCQLRMCVSPRPVSTEIEYPGFFNPHRHLRASMEGEDSYSKGSRFEAISPVD